MTLLIGFGRRAFEGNSPSPARIKIPLNNPRGRTASCTIAPASRTIRLSSCACGCVPRTERTRHGPGPVPVDCRDVDVPAPESGAGRDRGRVRCVAADNQPDRDRLGAGSWRGALRLSAGGRGPRAGNRVCRRRNRPAVLVVGRSPATVLRQAPHHGAERAAGV